MMKASALVKIFSGLAQRRVKIKWKTPGLSSSKEIGGFLQIIQYDASTDKNKVGVINGQGEEIIPTKYDKIIALGKDTGFIVQENQQFGIYNKNGRELLSPILDNVMIPGNSLNSTDEEVEFPLLCLLHDHYFYLTESGDILTLIINNTFSFKK